MKRHIKPLLFFILISAILIFSWFRYGYMYGGGDVGLQTYNPQRILENAKYVWWDSAGPGASLPQGLSAVPFQFGLFILQQIGFSPVAMQAALFLLLLTLMGFGMYLFVSTLFPQEKKYPLMAGIFYMFNPYMMIQVWHRFIHTTIVLAAVLPYLALFWNRWVKEGQVKNLLFFMLVSFLSVYAFGTYAFILAVWIFLLLFSLGATIPWQGRKQAYLVGLRFAFGFIIWILINAWWMIPVSQISPAVLSQQHKTEESLMTLITISSQEILPFSLQLVNPFYLVYQAEFGSIYKNTLFQIIPWVFVFIILYGLVNSIKHKTFSLYGIFYLIALFLAKGAASPFGNIYIFGFSNIFALGVLRNPFEKTGLILVFFSTVLFVLGLKILSERFGKLLVILICFLVLVFAWPMILGKVIGRFDQPAFVEVPESYQDADTWFSKQKEAGVADGKILHLPLTQAESIQYKWKVGYNGLEPSDTFFTAYPSISRGFNIRRVDDALAGLALSFQSSYADSAIILSNLQDFNVRFILLHKDVDWTRANLDNPQDQEKTLDKLNFLDRKQQFGDLVVYQLKDQYFKPRIAIERDLNLIYPGEESLSFWPAVIKDPGTKYISFVNAKEDSDISGYGQTLVFPKSVFLYGIASGSASPFEYLKGLQPTLQQTGMIQSLNLVNKILALSATLSSISTGQALDLDSKVDDYEQNLKQIFPKGIEINKFQVSGQESLLSSIFRIHLAALQAVTQKTDLAETIRQRILRDKEQLGKYLTEADLKPQFNDQDTEERQVFKFNVPVKDTYELVMLDPKAALYPENLNKVNFFVNNDQFQLSSKVSGNVLTFGSLSLEPGDLEISYPVQFSKNLALSVAKNGNLPYTEIPIDKINGSGMYKLSASVRVEGGSGFYVLFYENQNPQPSLKEFLQTNPLAGWQKFQMNLQTRPTTKSAKVVILGVENGNLQSQVLLQDVQVQAVLKSPVLLRSSRKEQILVESADEQVKFIRISPVSYEGKIKILKPGFLFFKETFHPGWKLMLSNQDGNYASRKHLLANLYGNAWYIDQAGEYEFKISFEGQNTFAVGILFTGTGLLAVAAYWILAKKFSTK